MDQNGNYSELGHLYKSGRDLPEIVSLIKKEISKEIPDIAIAIKTSRFSGGRSISIDIEDAGKRDITKREVKDALIERVGNIADRFNRSNGNYHSDYHSTDFYCHTSIATAAYTKLAEATAGVQNPVEKKMTLAAFKKTVKPGDRFDILHGAKDRVRIVSKVMSSELVFVDEIGNNKSHLGLGKAAAFACDGELVRIGLGDQYEPDRHLLYRWHRN